MEYIPECALLKHVLGSSCEPVGALRGLRNLDWPRILLTKYFDGLKAAFHLEDVKPHKNTLFFLRPSVFGVRPNVLKYSEDCILKYF